MRCLLLLYYFRKKGIIMAEITASLVKELREKIGAGMMECKNALTATNGSLEDALDWLRKKGLSVAAKKAGRVAAQGLVAVKAEGTKGAIAEVNIETDFAAKNPDFQAFVADTVQKVFDGGDMEAQKAALTALIAKIGENMSLRRWATLDVKQGVVASYTHNALVPNMGKIGVLVGLESVADAAALQPIAKQLAMHIAAAAPLFLDIASVTPEALDREKAIFTEQARNSGKPEAIIEKMVEGRIRKYYEEVVLLEQPYILDPEKKVKDVIADAAKTLQSSIDLTGFVRYALGEGIEKKTEDFAQEVAKQLS